MRRWWASWMRAFGLPPAPTSGFQDIAGGVHEKNIDALAAAGITRGCNPPANSLFCPNRITTRAQMASFLVRALGLPAAPSQPFVDVADTILVFTNTHPNRRNVRCVAYDRSGTPVGRTVTRLPGNGQRYILASDLSNGRDFIGHAVCNAGGVVLPSAILVGPEIENLGATVYQLESSTRIRFPLIATY